MKNLINTLTSITKEDIKNYGITEVFCVENELYTTSNYDLPLEIINKIEKEIL